MLRLSQRAGDQDRLVKATAPQSSSVEGNRHQDIAGRRIVQMNRHISSHRRCKRGLAAIFESKRKRAGDFPISDCGAHPVDRRWLRQAGRANLHIGRFQRDAAALASAGTKKLQLGPAIDAEASHLADDQPASGTTRRQCEIHCRPGQSDCKGANIHSVLSLAATQRTSARVTAPLFDRQARALRRDRAARRTPVMFLHQRAFEDCLERIGDVQRQFVSALLIGCPTPTWRAPLERVVANVEVIDPGDLFADAAKGRAGDEDLISLPAAGYDLCLAIGTLDTVPDLPRALLAIRHALRPDGFFIGAAAGGETVPMLRAAMRSADHAAPAASPHVHPRIEASAIAPLLGSAEFVMPVVDVDRVSVAYRNFDKLVEDLRGMAATNILSARSRRPLGRAARDAARAEFARQGANGVTRETFEILHFAAWTPSEQQG